MATLLDFLPLFQEDAGTIRERIDADANNGIAQDDPRYVDTREGTFFWDVTQPLVLEFARLYDALAVEVPASAFVAFAWGEYLDWHGEIFGLERKAAVAATGEVTLVGEPNTVIGTGVIISTELVDEEGDPIEFTTTESGETSDGLEAPANFAGTEDPSGGSFDPGTYYYVITATSEFGETLPSEEIEVEVVDPNGGINLEWDAVVDADSYRIYRGTVAGGPYGRIADEAAGGSTTYADAGTDSPGLAPPDFNGSAGVTLGIEAVETGTIGNVPSLSITELDTPILEIDALYNAEPTAGGTDTELDEELRERILLEFEGQGGGNQNDYRRWALAFPGVGRVFVQAAWDGPNTVRVVVMTSDGGPVAQSVIDDLQAELDPEPGLGDGTAPIGSTVTIDTPTIEEVDVSGEITFESGFSLDGGGGTTPRAAEITAALEEYLNNLEVGEDVIYEHVKAQFFTVDGVYNIANVQVNGDTNDVSVGDDPPTTAQLGTTTLS